jgi:hypothetical protein
MGDDHRSGCAFNALPESLIRLAAQPCAVHR